MGNTAPNSKMILIDCWITGDNWCVYHGRKTANGKTTNMKIEQAWKKLAEWIAAVGVRVARNARAIGAKIT